MNFETLRFLHVTREDLTEVTVHDVRRRRADAFAERASWELPGVRVRVEPDRGAAVGRRWPRRPWCRSPRRR
jgi:hypothetical protein